MTLLAQLAERNILLVFNERNSNKRKATLKDLWTADSVFWSAKGTYIGYKAIDRAISSLLRSYPEFSFNLLGEVDEIPDAARMRWSFGAAGAPPAITGLDVLVASNGHITAMYRFLDGAEL